MTDFGLHKQHNGLGYNDVCIIVNAATIETANDKLEIRTNRSPFQQRRKQLEILKNTLSGRYGKISHLGILNNN